MKLKMWQVDYLKWLYDGTPSKEETEETSFTNREAMYFKAGWIAGVQRIFPGFEVDE